MGGVELFDDNDRRVIDKLFSVNKLTKTQKDVIERLITFYNENCSVKRDLPHKEMQELYSKVYEYINVGELVDEFINIDSTSNGEWDIKSILSVINSISSYKK